MVPAVNEIDDPARAPITTGSSRYVMEPDGPGYRTTIDFAYTNPTPDTIYVVNCNGFMVMNLQKRHGEEWRHAWAGISNDCLSPPVVIPPGTEYADSVEIWGAPGPDPSVNTFEEAEIDGTYRLIWHRLRHHYRTDARNFGDTLAVEARLSNPFELRVSDP